MSTVAVLGAGGMGAAMVRRLRQQGHDVRIWDRTAEKAEALADTGAQPVPEVGDAVRGADAVLTVLTNGPAVDDVARQVLPALGSDAVWVQASTVGAEWADKLRSVADESGARMVDAPVSGSTQPAEQGSLIWLVSGAAEDVERVQPVLDALGTRTQHVGERQEASRLKLAVNVWMTAATVALADSLSVCDRLGVDRGEFLAALDGGPLNMPYGQQKAQLMGKREYPAGFPVELALKDVDLAREAGATEVPTIEHVAEILHRAVDAGHGRDDLAAVAEVTGSRSSS
jgi:3-hydroxyisobutyrate dehydrogenase